MRAFITNYFETSPSERQELRKQLEGHPVMQRMAKDNGTTVAFAVEHTLHCWEGGALVPQHDGKGAIIGFRPIEDTPEGETRH